jgi:cytochrome P450
LSTAIPSSELDPYAPEVLLAPYEAYATLRDLGPVVRLERYGIWAMARHAEVAASLQDWQLFSSDAGVGLSDFRKEPPWRPKSIILEVDPPYHTKTRSVLAKVLSPAAMQRLRPAFDAEAERLVEEVVERGAFDGMADLAEPYPIRVFGDALGLPEAGREHLLTYGAMAFNSFGAKNSLYEASHQDAQPVIAWINRMLARESMAPEGFAAEIYAAAEAGDIEQSEAPLLVRSFLTAGVDTTVNGIGNALFAFATNPVQWQALRDDPKLLKSAFDEVLRFESPVQTFFRTTTAPATIGDVVIPEGEKVYLSLGGANRDPRRWTNPDAFDIRRTAGGHVGFGYGVHGCVGRLIARLETDAVLSALARKVSSLELAGEPVRRLNNTLRGFTRLPLRVRRA